MSSEWSPSEVKRNSPIAPEGASCWICLEEGPDENGHPLMRNCACRGEASGFAHASCVAKYLAVEEKRKQVRNAEDVCKNCNQPYQGDMALAVAKARLDLVEAEGIEHSSVGYLMEMINLASFQHEVGDSQEAIRILQECLSIAQSNPTMPNSTRAEFNIMKTMGCFYCESQLDIEKGKVCLQNALKIAKKYGYHKEVEALEPAVKYFCHGKGKGGLDSSVVIRAALYNSHPLLPLLRLLHEASPIQRRAKMIRPFRNGVFLSSKNLEAEFQKYV